MKLKEKLTEVKGKIREKIIAMREKLSKLSFVKKWNEKRVAKLLAGPDPQSISEIYKMGGTKTRLQVALMVLLAFTGISLLSIAVKKFLHKYRPPENPVYEKIAHDLDALKKQEEANASVVSVGNIEADAANHTKDPNRKVRMGLDLWVRVGTPKDAKYVEDHYLKFTDKAVEALNILYLEKTSLIDDAGKERAKSLIKEKLNQVSETVVINEIFIYNLKFQ